MIRARVAALLILSTVFGGCISPQQNERAAMLALPYKEFDQTYGSGFRVYYDREEYLKGAQLIEDYLRDHPELRTGEQKFLHLHAGQAFALANQDSRAMKHFEEAISHEPAPELGPDWNEMLAATRAFLRHDRAALLAVKDRLQAGGTPQHVQAVEKLIEDFGSSYADALLWHRLGRMIVIPKDASPANRSAAEKISKAFGIPIEEMGPKLPSSCIQIELRPFAQGSPLFGYEIIHTASGTLIAGTSDYWLDEAVERFIRLGRERNGHREAKFGLATNFDWVR